MPGQKWRERGFIFVMVSISLALGLLHTVCLIEGAQVNSSDTLFQNKYNRLLSVTGFTAFVIVETLIMTDLYLNVVFLFTSIYISFCTIQFWLIHVW